MKPVRYSFLVVMTISLTSLCSFQPAQIPGKVKGCEVSLATDEEKKQLSQGYAYILSMVEQLKQQIDEHRVSDPERARKLRRLLGMLEDMMKDRKHPVVMMQAIIDFIDTEFPEEVAHNTDAADH